MSTPVATFFETKFHFHAPKQTAFQRLCCSQPNPNNKQKSKHLLTFGFLYNFNKPKIIYFSFSNSRFPSLHAHLFNYTEMVALFIRNFLKLYPRVTDKHFHQNKKTGKGHIRKSPPLFPPVVSEWMGATLDNITLLDKKKERDN